MIGYSSVIDGRPFLLLDRLAAYHLLNKLASAEGHSLPMLRTLWSAFRNRFDTSGDMICQRDRATYPRSIYGAIERIDLINIAWPLPEFERDQRDNAEKKSGGTASDFVPFKFSSIGTI